MVFKYGLQLRLVVAAGRNARPHSIAKASRPVIPLCQSSTASSDSEKGAEKGKRERRERGFGIQAKTTVVADIVAL
jgi:hypothetical protein